MFKLSGLKNTPSRLAVLSVLQEKKRPLDASEIYFSLGDKADQATVYRTLETFYKKGIIKRLEFQEGKFRYEISSKDHHHLVCQRCGRIDDINDNVMHKWEKQIGKEKGFRVKKHNLEFFGICSKCQL